MKSRLSKEQLSFIKTFVYNSERLFTELNIDDEHSAKLVACYELLAKVYPIAENAALELNINLDTKIPLQELSDSILDRSGEFFTLTQSLAAVINENREFQNVPVHFGLSAAEDFMDDVSQTEVLAQRYNKESALKNVEYMKGSIHLIKERSLLSWRKHQREIYSSLDSSDVNTRLARAISDDVEYMLTPDMYEAMALDALYSSVMNLAESKRPLTTEQIHNEITSQLKLQPNEKGRYHQITRGTPDLANLQKIVRDTQQRYFDTKNLCNNCDMALEGLGGADKSHRVQEIILQEAAQYNCEEALPSYLYKDNELKLPARWQKYEETLSVAADNKILTGIQMLTSQWVEITAQKVTALRQEINGLNNEETTPEQQGQFFERMFNLSKEVIRASNAADKYLDIDLNPSGAAFRHLKEFASSSATPEKNSYKFFDHLLGNFKTQYKKNESQFESYKTDMDHLEFIDRLEAQQQSLERRNIYFYANFAYEALYDDASQNAERTKYAGLDIIKEKHIALSERVEEFANCLDLPKEINVERVSSDIDTAVSEYFLIPLYRQEKPLEDAFEQAVSDVTDYYKLDAAQQDQVESLLQYHHKETAAFHQDYIKKNDDARQVTEVLEESEYNHLFAQGFALSLYALKSGYENEQENYRQYKQIKTDAYQNQRQDNSIALLLKKTRSGRK